MTTVRVLIVDDHPVVLSGLRLLLSLDPRFAICAQANSVVAARAAALAEAPDVIVTDLVLGGADGMPLIEGLRSDAPDARIVIYSSLDETLWAPLALRAGAHGYVSKAEPLDAVATAIEAVLAGKLHVGSGASDRRERDNSPVASFDLTALSPRELLVLRLIGEGRDLADMSRELGLSVKTIGTYRERLKIKLGFDTIRRLERFAIEQAFGQAPAR